MDISSGFLMWYQRKRNDERHKSQNSDTSNPIDFEIGKKKVNVKAKLASKRFFFFFFTRPVLKSESAS